MDVELGNGCQMRTMLLSLDDTIAYVVSNSLKLKCEREKLWMNRDDTRLMLPTPDGTRRRSILTRAYELGDMAVACHLAVGDFLHGRVDGVEEGFSLITACHSASLYCFALHDLTAYQITKIEACRRLR